MIGVTSSRRIGKMDKPRPLKIINMVDQSLESVLSDMDQVSQRLSSSALVDPSLLSLVASLCENLRMFGPQLESIYKDQLDRCFVSLRNGCRDDRLSLASRYRLLEVIELRAMHWMPNENLTNYYKQKLVQIEAEESALENQQHHMNQSQQPELSPYLNQPTMITPTGSVTSPIFPPQALNQYPTPYSTPQTPIIYTGQHQILQQQQTLQTVQHQSTLPTSAPPPPSLSPGEVVKTSGKFLKPTRIAGKNYCKDEVVIRNADSGKVMGMKGRRVHMIEELSETIISFQRVTPGARERLVQITGPNEENISHAIQLIEETIRRNASPIRSEDEQRGIYATHGGSTSSISSHTSDDAVQSSKRNNLLNAPHCDEDLPTEYKYTVAHGGDSIRITGSNLDLVRTAKLILDEHLNGGEKRLNNGFVPFEFQPKEVPKDITPSKGADSPTSTPSYSPLSSSPPKKSSSPPIKLNSPTIQVQPASIQHDHPPEVVKGTVTIVRQPLIPSSSKETIESVENIPQVSNADIKNRRAMFAKTSDEKSTDESAVSATTATTVTSSSGTSQTPQRISHIRDFLIRCADSPHARCTPQDWSHVVRTCPPAVKKGWLHIPSLLQIMNEKGDNTINVIPTYLQKNELIDSSEIVNAPHRWSLLRTMSNNTDDDDNGNSN